MTSRNRLIVLTAIALLLSLVVAGPAAGGPNCDKNPAHSDCSDVPPLPDHPDGATCEATGEQHAWIVATDGFTETMPDKVLCVDWTTTKASAWRFTATTEGRVRSVRATVRDSHPGDFCWNDATGDFLDAPTVSPVLPVAAIDICGTEYADVADPPEAAIPYVLTLSFSGHRASVVTVTVEEVPAP